MIVFKNNFEETEDKPDGKLINPIEIIINESVVKITKNYPQLHDIIEKAVNCKDKSETIRFNIPNLTQFKMERKQTESNYYSSSSDSDDNYYYGQPDYSTGHRKVNLSVLHSNFDDREMEDILSFAGIQIVSGMYNNYREYSDDYKRTNEILLKSKLPTPNLPNIINNSEYLLVKKSIAIEQFQLILDGFDVIISDFLVNDMIQIADIFKFQELIDAINPLKEQIENLDDYNKFSELEILLTFEDFLTSIDESNFNEESSIVYSIFLYIEKKLFRSILNYFSLLYPAKYPIYLKIADLINSKFGDFNFEVNFEVKTKSSQSYPFMLYYMQKKVTRVNDNLLKIIKEDDQDSLQKLSCNPTFKFEDEQVFLPIYKAFENVEINPECNAIECAAFYGSIKCFKFLKLNEQLNSIELAKYAVAGGNTEIIHLCDQNKCSFRNTLKIAIYYHQNDIAEWIVDNNKDLIREDIYDICYNAVNFDMLQFFLSRKAESTLNVSKSLVKYILYIKQNCNVSIDYPSPLNEYLMKYKCMNHHDDFGLVFCPNEKVELLYMDFQNRHNYSSLIRSPLNLAAYNGDLELCEFLINYIKIENQQPKNSNRHASSYAYSNHDFLRSSIENDLRGESIYLIYFLMIFIYIYILITFRFSMPFYLNH